MYRTLTLLVLSTTLMAIASAERLDPVDESRPHILNVYIEGHEATCFGQGIDTKQLETLGLKHVPEIPTKGGFTVTVEFNTGPHPPERLAVELYFPSWLVVPPKYDLKLPEKGVEIDHPEPNSTLRADLEVEVGEGPNPLSIGDEYYLVAVLRDPTKKSDVLDYVVFKLRFGEPRGGESTPEQTLLKVTRSALVDVSMPVAGFILGSLSALVAEIVCGWIHSGPAALWATVIGGLVGAFLVSI
ncbi:hypothetical protein [Methanopyrus kandleri]